MCVPIGSPMGTPHCEKVRSPCGSSAKDIKDETIVGVWCQQQWTSREVSSLSLVRERMFAQCSSANSVHLPDISTCLTIFYPLLCFAFYFCSLIESHIYKITPGPVKSEKGCLSSALPPARSHLPDISTCLQLLLRYFTLWNFCWRSRLVPW